MTLQTTNMTDFPMLAPTTVEIASSYLDAILLEDAVSPFIDPNLYSWPDVSKHAFY